MSQEDRMDVHSQIQTLEQLLNRSIIGQNDVVERLLLTLLCDGNVLVEHYP
ncbi:hypothetical protein [Desulforhopalus singaporensis]|uniref:MoxR-like ATPase n=1 Tax=Desulforhopalus singaporensis TaxID=91360 RepID=A0A1H0VGB0_9BACT|nr:hypothetical protein [Desulforhopalus singaporensis]SDP77373.1 MoxR-like ATPase [Desulforhopalus singaporensis]